MKKYSLKQIKNYILSQDSLEDVSDNLTEDNVEKFNQNPESKESDVWYKSDFFDFWDKYLK